MTASILIVDDSPTVRAIARKYLEELGIKVREAEDGKAALDEIKTKGSPDGVLLDYNMPVMNGPAFLEALRADNDISQPVVIFCTTENDISTITSMLQMGANDYIMKPFDQDILQDKLIDTGLIEA